MAAGEEQTKKSFRSRQAVSEKRLITRNHSVNELNNDKDNPVWNPKTFSFRSNAKRRRFRSDY
ncbi:unnamed protein product [Amaranthus hypochondriacus]